MLKRSTLERKNQLEETPLLSRLYLSIEKNIFDLLLNTSNASSTAALVFIFAYWLIVTLQLCHFIGSTYLPYQWDARVSHVFITVCEFVSRFPGVENTTTAYNAAIAVVCVPWGVSILAALLHKVFRWRWPFVIAHHVLYFASTTLFLPTAAVLIQMLFGCLENSKGDVHPFFPDMVCWDDHMAGYATASCILLIMYFLCTVAVHLTFFPTNLPNDLNGKDVFLARTLNRVETISVVAKLALLLLFSAGRSDTWRGPMGFLLLLCGGVMTTLHIRALEPYSDTVAALYLTQWMLLCWAGIVAVFVSFLHDAQGTGMLFFIGLPLVIVSAVCAVRWRYTSAASLESRELTSGMDYVMMARAHMRAYINANSSCCYWTDDSPSLSDAHTKLLDAVDAVLEQGTARFPECMRLRCFRVAYFLYVRENRVMALRELALMDGMESFLDVRFTAYAAHATLAASTEKHRSVEVERYIEFKERKALADQATSEAAKMLVMFCSELLGRNPSIDTLANTGYLARERLLYALSLYDRLLEINEESVSVLRTMGNIYLYITGELQKAADVIAQADAIENQLRTTLHAQSEKGFMVPHTLSLDIFDDRNAVIGVSLAENSFGCMESVNISACRTFGYDSSLDMVGKNLSIIMPKEVGEHHDALMKNCLLRKQSRVINYTRTVFGMHATTSFLVPVDLYARFSGDFSLVGVLQPLAAQPTHAYITIDPRRGVIISATRTFIQLFGQSRRDLMAQTLRIGTIIPVLDEEDGDDVQATWKKVMRKDGFETVGVHNVTGRKLHVHLWGAMLEVVDTALLFVKLDCKQMEENDQGAENDISGDDNDAIFSQKFASALSTCVDESENARMVPARNPLHTDLVIDRTGSNHSVRSLLSPAHSVHSATSAASTSAPFFFASTETPQSVANAPLFLPQRNAVFKKHYGEGSLAAPPKHRPRRDEDDEDAPTTAKSTAPRPFNPSPKADSDALQSIREVADMSYSSASLMPGAANDDGSDGESEDAFPQPGPSFLDAGLHSRAPAPLVIAPPSPANIKHPYLFAAKASASRMSSPVAAGQVDAATAQAETEAAKAADNVAAEARRRRNRAVHHRLRRAIRNDNRVTERKLKLMSVVSVLMVLAMMVAALVLFFLFETEVGYLTDTYDMLYYSATRSTYVSESVTTLISYWYQLMYPGDLAFQYHPYVHSAYTPEAVTSYTEVHYKDMLARFAVTSSHIESFVMGFETKAIKELRTGGKSPLEFLVGDTVRQSFMSLKEASRTFSAMAQRSLWLIKTMGVNAATQDISFWWVIANGPQKLRTIAGKLTDLLLDAFRVYEDQILLQPVYVLLVSVAVMLTTTWFVVRPIVVRVEEGKTKVLDIFLGIPRPIRRALRRRALKVYNGIKKQDEADMNAHIQADEDDAEDAQAREDQSVLDSLSEDDTLSRYTNTRQDTDDPRLMRPSDISTRMAMNLSSRRSDVEVDIEAHVPKTIDLHALNVNVQREAKRTDVTTTTTDDKHPEKAKFNIFSRRVVRVFAAKYFVFTLVVIAYFICLSVLSQSYLSQELSLAHLFVISARRMPMLQMSWHMARMNVLTNYTDLVETQPNSPFVRSGNYVDLGIGLFDEAHHANLDASFGIYDLTRRNIPELHHVLFENPCDTTAKMFKDYGLIVDDYFMKNCNTVADGILRKGLYSLWLDVTGTLHPLLSDKFTNIRAFLDSSTPHPLYTSEVITAVMETINKLGESINFFIGPLLKLSVGIIHVDALQMIDTFAIVRVVILFVYLAALVLLYILVLYPTAQMLSSDADKTKSLMLLLPPDIIAHVGPIQEYITENLVQE